MQKSRMNWLDLKDTKRNPSGELLGKKREKWLIPMRTSLLKQEKSNKVITWISLKKRTRNKEIWIILNLEFIIYYLEFLDFE